MGNLSTDTRTRLMTRLTKLEEQLDAANETLDSALATDIDEYRFDSGEGSQRTRYRNIKHLRDSIDWLEQRIDSVRRRLNNSGIVNMNMRRKNYYTYRSTRTV